MNPTPGCYYSLRCTSANVRLELVQEVSSAYSELRLGRHAAAAGSAGHVFPYDAAGSADGADSSAGMPWASGVSSACRQLQYSLIQPYDQGPSRWEPAQSVPSKVSGNSGTT